MGLNILLCHYFTITVNVKWVYFITLNIWSLFFSVKDKIRRKCKQLYIILITILSQKNWTKTIGEKATIAVSFGIIYSNITCCIYYCPWVELINNLFYHYRVTDINRFTVKQFIMYVSVFTYPC